MTFSMDLAQPHRVAAANAHTYTTPTEALYIDRTLVYHDFIYLIEGQWLFSEQVNGEEVNYLLHPGDVLILPAGNHHYTRLPCMAGTRTFCIHISRESYDMDSSHPGNIVIPSHRNCRDNNQIYTLFKEIVDTFWADPPYKEQQLSALFTLLICQLSAAPQPAEYPPEVLGAIRLIHEAPHITYSSQDLAKALGVSSRSLSQNFRDATGESLRSYQQNRKLERIALQLQIEPDIRLKELATTFGFYDEFYLSKQFKKKYGVSPAQYKKGTP